MSSQLFLLLFRGVSNADWEKFIAGFPFLSRKRLLSLSLDRFDCFKWQQLKEASEQEWMSAALSMSQANRVTRLGEFLPNGRLFALSSFDKITEIASRVCEKIQK
jgi:hypothetical protein